MHATMHTTTTGATKFAEALTENKTLENLWLADCGLSSEGGRVMTEVIQRCTRYLGQLFMNGQHQFL